MEIAYCWQCKRDVVMFDEVEWARLAPLLDDGLQRVKSYRSEHAVVLGDVPMRDVYSAVLREHKRVAGHADVRPQDIWHHRRNSHGPLCPRCSKPWRTPTAQQCAACGLPADAV